MLKFTTNEDNAMLYAEIKNRKVEENDYLGMRLREAARGTIKIVELVKANINYRIRKNSNSIYSIY